ncbi:uncharacterized protein HD556DRAFT_1423622 [Suillus plorans]|uniref:Uncharacterized protein n=1 Tax=Suillus plorans TaxID=116603 RepID=A0A9P7DAS0_9AGAM|nr:uncharacterized protein HD556DRAFT_1423622 [Suillus plorans]KAG1785282.1 hypothetical protein HD556DRAFT_1423622 [Suillus plorans]
MFTATVCFPVTPAIFSTSRYTGVNNRILGQNAIDTFPSCSRLPSPYMMDLLACSCSAMFLSRRAQSGIFRQRVNPAAVTTSWILHSSIIKSIFFSYSSVQARSSSTHDAVSLIGLESFGFYLRTVLSGSNIALSCDIHSILILLPKDVASHCNPSVAMLRLVASCRVLPMYAASSRAFLHLKSLDPKGCHGAKIEMPCRCCD